MEVVKVEFRETCHRGIYTGLTLRFQKIINFMLRFLVLFANFNGTVIKFEFFSKITFLIPKQFCVIIPAHPPKLTKQFVNNSFYCYFRVVGNALNLLLSEGNQFSDN